MSNKTPEHPFAAEAADLNTTPEHLADLGRNRTLMPIVAANPATPASTLEVLGNETDTTIRRALAQNPNTSLPLLLTLAQEFPKEFLANPILPLLNLSQPDFIKNIPSLTWFHLLRDENVPTTWLNLLRQGFVRVPDSDKDSVLRTVQSHVSIAGELHEPWTIQPETDHTGLLNRIARHPHLPLTLFPSFANAAASTRHAIANNPYIPTTLLHQLARANHTSIRRATALHHATPLEDLERLALDPETPVRAAASRNRKLNADLYGLLASDANPEVRAALARNTHAPEYILTALAHDHDFLVRCEAAHNPRLPKDAFSVLFNDKENVVRYHLAHNSQLPQEMFLDFIQHRALPMHKYLALNKRIPLQILEMLMHTQDKDILKNIAKNPQASPDLLTRLAQNSELEVYMAVAAHKHTPPETLRWLLIQHRRDSRLLYRLIANPHTPFDMLEQILLKDNLDLCFRAATHPTILQHQSHNIHASLLTNIQKGSSSSDDRLSLLRYPSLSVEILTAFSKTAFAVERCFVTLHPKTPRPLLQTLTHDGNRYVRSLARIMLANTLKKEAL